MVWSRERDAERPPLSVILPRFYLGAERDVTQDRLASLDISYVLSVNRCSPQPSFLPGSRYLRIPIDDSLWDDLLPWIPQALHFIDAAMSSGASVLVHCAAGISRSPALAVAYIMYSLGMDLDHAYRFVKERRPSISPNFNFLGQLQHFQGTLRQNGDLLFQRLDPHQPPADSSTPTGHSIRQQPGGDSAEVVENSCHTDKTQQRLSHPDGTQRPSLSLNLTLNQNKQQEASGSVTKPTQLQLPACSASLLEKRKSLSLCLTPLGTRPPSPDSQREARAAVTSTAAVHKRETAAGEQRESGSGGGGGAAGSFGRVEDSLRERSPTRAKEQGVLSPLSFTLNKLLGWGERVLLGGVFVPPVRMGQPALPYRC